MGNNFTNNYNSKLPPGNGAVIALEMKTSNINAEFLEMDNMFVNDNLGIDARVFVQVDQSYVSKEPTVIITEKPP